MSAASALFKRELTLRARHGGWAVGAGLFVALGSVAPLAIGNDLEVLSSVGPGLLWIILGMAVFLGVEGLFEDDLSSGSMDIFALSPVGLTVTILIKMLVAWLFLAVPLTIAAPLLLLGYGSAITGVLGLIIASPGMVFTAATVSAIASGQRRGAPLLVFCTLPLIIPALVFGPQTGNGNLVPYLILAAYSLQAVAACPFLASAAVRLHMS